jgi:hypothetical protein
MTGFGDLKHKSHRPIFIALMVCCLLALPAQAQPRLYVTSPNGGEVWSTAIPHDITWTGGAEGNLSIWLYQGDDAALLIAESTPNDGQLTWQIPDGVIAGSNYRVEVFSSGIDTLHDIGDGYFTITIPPVVTVTSPNGGENWLVGSTHDITWTDNVADNFSIALYRGAELVSNLAVTAPNTGRFAWMIPVTLEQDTIYRIRLTGNENPAAVDESDSTFTISVPPWVRVVSPNGGELWIVGETEMIRWNSGQLNAEEPVWIEFKRNFLSSNWVTLEASAPNTGSYAWIVTGPNTTTARVRIRGATNTMASDTSDGNFSIQTTLNDLARPEVVIMGDGISGKLVWKPIPGAHRYRVFSCSMVSGSYSWIATTSDTSATVDLTFSMRQFFYVVAEH